MDAVRDIVCDRIPTTVFDGVLAPMIRDNEMMRLELSLHATMPPAAEGDPQRIVRRRICVERSLRDPQEHCQGSTHYSFRALSDDSAQLQYGPPVPLIGEQVVEAFVTQPIGEMYTSYGRYGLRADVSLSICGKVTLNGSANIGHMWQMDELDDEGEPEDPSESTAFTRRRRRVWIELVEQLDGQLAPMLTILLANKIPDAN